MRLKCSIILSLILASTLARPEEIELKDGSKLAGTLTSVEGDAFHVKTTYGEIQVPRSQIVQIRFAATSPKTDPEGGESSPAAASVDESLAGSTYSNRTAHFQVTMPRGWGIAPELRKKDIVAALKSADQAEFFMVTPEKYAGALKTYEILAETQIQSNFQEFEKLSEAPARLDNRNGLRLVFKAKKGTTPFRFLVYILPYDGAMVRLSFFTLEPLYNDAEPVFEKIAQSYHSTADKPFAQLSLPANRIAQ